MSGAGTVKTVGAGLLAMAVGQSMTAYLIHRYRKKARIHISNAVHRKRIS